MSFIKNALTFSLGRRSGNYGWRATTPEIDLANRKNIALIFTDGRLGDAIVNSALVDGLRRSDPKLVIDVFSGPATEAYWRSHPGVSNVIPIPMRGSARDKIEFIRVGYRYRGKIDVGVTFDPLTTLETMLLVSALQPALLIGFMKHEYRRFDISLVDFTFGPQKKHVTSRIESLLCLFGIDAPYLSLHRHIPVDPRAVEKFRAAYQVSESEPLLFFNAFGRAPTKTFTPENIALLLDAMLAELPDFRIAVSLSAEQAAEDPLASARSKYGDRAFVWKPGPELDDLFAAVSVVRLVVSPDTGTAHVAAALNKPLFSFFEGNLDPLIWKAQCECSEVIVSASRININDQDWPAALDQLRAFLKANSNPARR